MKLKRRTKIIGGIIGVVVLVIIGLDLNAGPRSSDVEYGVTFGYQYAQNLGLDWKKVYEEMFTDLHAQRVRISANWDTIQPNGEEYDYAALDYQVHTAEKYHAEIILAVGNRLPRWPECHTPGWIAVLPKDQQDAKLLSYIENVVERYQHSPSVTIWQVENEAFLGSFGECPPLDKKVLDQEIALVKKLDPSKQILITDSGELSSWVPAGNRGDIFGTTYYRYIFSDVLKRYWVNFYFPGWFYRAKAGIVRLLNPGKPVILAELQAEPWTTQGITNTPLDEQFKTMSIGKFRTIVRYASGTGFSPQYLWGVEWWYWMKEHGHPEYIEYARTLLER